MKLIWDKGTFQLRSFLNSGCQSMLTGVLKMDGFCVRKGTKKRFFCLLLINEPTWRLLMKESRTCSKEAGSSQRIGCLVLLHSLAFHEATKTVTKTTPKHFTLVSRTKNYMLPLILSSWCRVGIPSLAFLVILYQKNPLKHNDNKTF